jgi:hypothetical protein
LQREKEKEAEATERGGSMGDAGDGQTEPLVETPSGFSYSSLAEEDSLVQRTGKSMVQYLIS